jgi:lipid A 3-O-deacylase
MSLRAVCLVLSAGILLMPSGVRANDYAGFELRGGIFAHSVDEPSATSTMLNIDRIEDANIEFLWSVPSLTQW